MENEKTSLYVCNAPDVYEYSSTVQIGYGDAIINNDELVINKKHYNFYETVWSNRPRGFIKHEWISTGPGISSAEPNKEYTKMSAVGYKYFNDDSKNRVACSMVTDNKYRSFIRMVSSDGTELMIPVEDVYRAFTHKIDPGEFSDLLNEIK